jgi:hypothetical protein
MKNETKQENKYRTPRQIGCNHCHTEVKEECDCIKYIDTAKRLGRANYVCSNCGKDVSMMLFLFEEAKLKNTPEVKEEKFTDTGDSYPMKYNVYGDEPIKLKYTGTPPISQREEKSKCCKKCFIKKGENCWDAVCVCKCHTPPLSTDWSESWRKHERENNRPVFDNQFDWISSHTQKVRQEAKDEVNASLADYLKELENKVRQEERMKIRQLLEKHSYEEEDENGGKEVVRLKDILSALSQEE